MSRLVVCLPRFEACTFRIQERTVITWAKYLGFSAYWYTLNFILLTTPHQLQRCSRCCPALLLLVTSVTRRTITTEHSNLLHNGVEERDIDRRCWSGPLFSCTQCLPKNRHGLVSKLLHRIVPPLRHQQPMIQQTSTVAAVQPVATTQSVGPIFVTCATMGCFWHFGSITHTTCYDSRSVLHATTWNRQDVRLATPPPLKISWLLKHSLQI